MISEEAWEEAIRRCQVVEYPTSDIAAICKCAFARFIQEVSDAAKVASDQFATHPASAPCIGARNALAPFILPGPVDPVKEALAETYGGAAPEFVSAFHAAIAKRGLKIVPAGEP